MAHNKLKQALRILFKERRITIINIAGLSISLTCALFMLLWVQHELSFDRYHTDFEQLYRVEEDQYYSGAEPYHVNVTPYISGPVWKDEVPEIFMMVILRSLKRIRSACFSLLWAIGD